jgi:hypothetical protein
VVDSTKERPVVDYKNLIHQYIREDKILVHNVSIDIDPLD